jgi:hypothetical protein
MVENGVITVTCEFCSATYVFQPNEVASEVASEEEEAGAGSAES